MATLWPIVRFEWRRTRRNFAPVFFALAFPVLMLCMFGGIYGNEPSEQFDGRGTVDMSVPAYLVLVVAVTGLMSFPSASPSTGTARSSSASARRRSTRPPSSSPRGWSTSH